MYKCVLIADGKSLIEFDEVQITPAPYLQQMYKHVLMADGKSLIEFDEVQITPAPYLQQLNLQTFPLTVEP
ncbi:hypothetical protein AAES_20283 [Amazona aestiva]|uniref:Uncharacterized protein n=1 Tax=Amazona aestiva TaxID=12930 RepID=A0A0Q3X877_AMAAE|nr:hypothetical protein AAES_20283 [Amazona aestiva]